MAIKDVMVFLKSCTLRRQNMALRLAHLILFFYLLLLMFDHGSGARDIANHERWKQVEVIDQKQSNYITSYKQNTEKSDYVAAYGSQHGGYLVADITKRDTEEFNHSSERRDVPNHEHQKQVEEKESNYITGYRTHNHGSGAGEVADDEHRKQVEEKSNYLTGYRTHNHGSEERDVADDEHWKQVEEKESNYLTGYRTHNHGNEARDVADDEHWKQVEEKESNYITQYGPHNHGSGAGDVPDDEHRKQAEEKESNYITAYGTKRDPEQSGYKAACDTKEGEKDSQYEATYGTKQGYSATYSNKQEDKDPDYITAYNSKREKKDSPYAAPYGTKQDYSAAYSTREDSKGPVMMHEGQVAGKPSFHMDHSEAFKKGFFTRDDLYVGRVMAVRFPIQEFPHFLPREEADSIPFSETQLPNVLQLFSIPIGSPDAKAMQDTLQQCESSPIRGEIKFCATSLESMLDFVNKVMGSWTNLNLLTTTHPTISVDLIQTYTVLRISKEIFAPKWVACHPLPYPYKVFFCHFIERSKIFKVSLGAENGQKVEAVGVCHMDTSDWDPNHIIFRQLGVKAGKSPICHFLPVHHLVWVPSPTSASI